MPFTPFHWGPALLIGFLVFPLLNIPVFIIANVLVDIEPLAILILDGPVLHGFFHTFLGATLAGLALIPIGYLLRNVFASLLRLFGLNQSPSVLSICTAALIGTNFHVLLDAFLYLEMHPFFPLLGNPLYGFFSTLQVYGFCIAAFIGAIPLYVFHVWRSQTRTNPP